MNEQGAIKDIRENICTGKGSSILCRDECMYGERRCAYQLAIKALEKQIPKKVKKTNYKPFLKDGWKHECPTCGSAVGINSNAYDYTQEDEYCASCCQKLDWTVEE